MFLPQLSQDLVFDQMPDTHLTAPKYREPQKMSTVVSTTILFGFIFPQNSYTHTHTHTEFTLVITFWLIQKSWLWNQYHKVIRADN